jgi:hypothetical protein
MGPLGQQFTNLAAVKGFHGFEPDGNDDSERRYDQELQNDHKGA